MVGQVLYINLKNQHSWMQIKEKIEAYNELYGLVQQGVNPAPLF